MNLEQSLLVITAPPRLEEALVDWLLENAQGLGFTSAQVNGHSSQHGGLSLAEQVSGRRRRVQFQIHAEPPRIDQLLVDLAGEFRAADIHYWVTPLLRAGHLG